VPTTNFTRRALLLAAVLGLAACGTAEPTVETSSTSEAPDLSGQTIVVYSGRSESLVADLFAEFTAATGIAVEVRYGDSGELAALLLTEGAASPADVYFSQDAGALGAVSDLLAELPGDVVDAVDARFRSASGRWLATSGRVRVAVYDPRVVDVPPAGIDDLLDPKWRGRIGFAPTNASWQSFVTALRVVRGEEAAREWLVGFAANEPRAYEKNGVVRDAVNSGEVAIGLVNHYYLYEKIAAEGEAAVVARNHYFTDGDVGGLVNIAGVGVLASSARRDAALALVRYLVSAAGQTYFAERTFEYPLAAGILPRGDLPSLDGLNPPAIDLSDLRSIEATQELLADVGLLTR